MKPATGIILKTREGSRPLGAAWSHTTGLPMDILRSASPRLTWVSLIYGFGFLGFFLVLIATVPGFSERDTFRVELATVVLSVFLASFIFALSKGKRISPRQLVDIGLIFEVLGGFGISMVEHWGVFGGSPTKVFGISWVCVWIVVFPLIVPSTPGKALIAAILTASTGLLAYTLSVAFGKSGAQPYYILIWLFSPTYLSALVAFLAAKIIYRLGTHVRDARRIGDYELVEPLGKGGMGEVWRAHHRFLSRPAALKLIRPEVLGPASMGNLQKRFEREAEATAALKSPHSIILYDFGVTDGGIFYYVMELLTGLDLRSLIDRFGPLPVNRVVYLLRQMCHSLMDAHDNGFIHRDIKPANVYLCNLGPDYDFIKILDFGLAKFQRTSGEDDPSRGMILGTPGYIAPEVIVGETDLGPQADIYSLGCVAYWLLTGRQPFEGVSTTDIIRKHVTESPIPPSQRTEVDIPESLDEIVLASLEKNPQDRIQSAGDFMETLSELDVSPPWTNAKAEEWWIINMAKELSLSFKETKEFAHTRRPRL